MTVSFFSNGGFVAHKIRNGCRIYSAWFDANGKMIEIEATARVNKRGVAMRYENGMAVPVSHVNIRESIACVGSGIHRNRDAYRV